MNSLDSLLVTEEYWFEDRTSYHVVFAKSATVARQYSHAKGLNIKACDKPTRMFTRAVTVHNANAWYANLVMPIEY